MIVFSYCLTAAVIMIATLVFFTTGTTPPSTMLLSEMSFAPAQLAVDGYFLYFTQTIATWPIQVCVSRNAAALRLPTSFASMDLSFSQVLNFSFFTSNPVATPSDPYASLRLGVDMAQLVATDLSWSATLGCFVSLTGAITRPNSSSSYVSQSYSFDNATNTSVRYDASCAAILYSDSINCFADEGGSISVSSLSKLGENGPQLARRFVKEVVPLRAQLRLLHASTISFNVEARNALLMAQRGPISIGMNATETNDWVITSARPLAVRLQGHYDTLQDKYASMMPLLIQSGSTVQRTPCDPVRCYQVTSTPFACPASSLAFWLNSSAVTTGASVVEAALVASLTLLLASQSTVEVVMRAHCVGMTFTAAKMVAEDLPALIVAGANLSYTQWSLQTFALLGNGGLPQSHQRLETVLGNRASLSSLASNLDPALVQAMSDGVSSVGNSQLSTLECVAAFFQFLAGYADAPPFGIGGVTDCFSSQFFNDDTGNPSRPVTLTLGTRATLLKILWGMLRCGVYCRRSTQRICRCTTSQALTRI